MPIFSFLIGFYLLSGLSFADYSSTFNDTTGIFFREQGDLLAPGTCYDLDRFTVNYSEEQNMTEIAVACGSTEADLKIYLCGTGSITTVLKPDGGKPSVRLAQLGPETYNTNPLFRAWNYRQTSYIANNMIDFAGVTGEARYYTMQLAASGGNCKDLKIYMNNNTYNPFLISQSWNQSFYNWSVSRNSNALSSGVLAVFLTDMGYTNETAFGYTWEYDNNSNSLYTIPSYNKQAWYGYTDDTSFDLSTVDCNNIEPLLSGDSINDINIPSGTHDIFCANTSQPSWVKTNFYKWAIIKFLNSSFSKVTVSIGAYTDAWVGIFQVTHYPANPLPNMSVTISWHTTSAANGTAYYRMKPLGDWTTGWSAWGSISENETSTNHNIPIPGSDILDAYQYQYYVRSAGATANNNGIYYNFTVGSYTLPVSSIPAGWDNQTGPLFYNGTADFARNTGLSHISVVWIFTVFMIIVMTAGALIATGNMALAAGVFIISVALFSTIGFLPYYFVIIIALLFALAMIKLFGVIFNG